MYYASRGSIGMKSSSQLRGNTKGRLVYQHLYRTKKKKSEYSHKYKITSYASKYCMSLLYDVSYGFPAFASP